MKYEVVDTIIPQDKRREINDKILHMIDHQLCDQMGISSQDIFNAYTGEGGLHRQQFSDYGNYHKYSEAKKEFEQGQFFTPHILCKFLIECIQPTSFDMIADLTAGTGNFFNWLPNLHNVYGNEIDIKAYKVLKHLYPEVHATTQDIRYFNADVRFDIILGNPPFNLNWRVDREEYLSQLYYCIKAHNLLKPAGLLALIVPTSFMSDDFSDGGIIKEMNERFHFIHQVKIPQNAFKQMGVSNFSTKIMFFQKISEHLPMNQPYQTHLESVQINSQTAETIFKGYIAPVVVQKEKVKGKLFYESLKANKSAERLQDQIKKLLFDIKRNPKINNRYAAALEYVNRFMTEEKPSGMKYDEWEETRIKEDDVLSFLKKLLKEQHRIERDEIKLVKSSYGLKLKAYSDKMNTYLDHMTEKKEVDFTDMILNQEYGFEDLGYKKLLNKKVKLYDQQSAELEDLSLDPQIDSFLKQFSLVDPYEHEDILLNPLQLKDTNLLLQKKYGYLQWEQGSGKTISAIAQMMYRMKFNHVRNVFVISTAIAINNTWETFLKFNHIDYRRIKSIADIKQIRKGEIVLVTLDMLCKLKKFIKKNVKVQSKKLMLVFDEADAISNPSSKRTKAALSCFRKLPFKLLLSGTMTRNTIAEAYPQFEILYNNSINMLSESEYIYKRKKEDPDQLIEHYNPLFMRPIPAFTEGYTLFTQSHIPIKITVFGVGQHSQDIYNADALKKLIHKTILTRTFEEVTGRKSFKPVQHQIRFQYAERELNRLIVEEFYNMHYLFTSTGNLRKDRMLEILNQLRLMLKACTIPQAFREYNSHLEPTKIKKLVTLLQGWENEQVAIGVRHVEVVDLYAATIRKAFPDRPVFVVTGNRVPLNKRREITSNPLRKAKDGILICTQQSLSSSVNIGYIDKIIIPELYWNDPAMSQFWSRFIRFNSKNPNKEVHFITYQESIECNLLGG